MTVQEIKEMFRQIRKVHKEINHLTQMIAAEEASLLPKAIQYNKERIQISFDDKLSTYIVDIVGLKERLGESIYKLKRDMSRAEYLISLLEDSDEREVMRYYYLDKKNNMPYKWEEVAVAMGFEERTIYRIHGNALKHISEKLISNCQ